MCPKGDDPLTINQNYRALQMEIITGSSYPLSGKLGLTFLGKTTFLDLQYLTSEQCTNTLAFSGKFANLLCTVTRLNSGFRYLVQLVFYSWPTYPKESNLYVNDGNPSKFDFYCDVSQASPIVVCNFEDVEATNIRGVSLPFITA